MSLVQLLRRLLGGRRDIRQTYDSPPALEAPLLEAEHRRGAHDVLRRQGCPECHAADAAMPKGLADQERLRWEGHALSGRGAFRTSRPGSLERARLEALDPDVAQRLDEEREW